MQNLRIEELKEIRVLSVRRVGDYKKSAKEAFKILWEFARKYKAVNDKTMVFGAGYDNPKIVDIDKLRFDACISWDNREIKPEGEVKSGKIAGGKYAIFLHKGSYDNLMQSYEEIEEWVEKEKIELREKCLPWIEKYLNCPDNTKPENLRTEILIPIQ